MASEAVGGNMHMDTRVIKVADVNSEVIGPPRSFGGCNGLRGRHGLGGNMHMDTRVIMVADIKTEVI